MRELVKRPLAEKDLKGIWAHSFSEWGEEQADTYLWELNTRIARLSKNPNLGRPRDEIRRGYRSLRVNHHIVFYTVSETAVRIIRVLHERMEVERHV